MHCHKGEALPNEQCDALPNEEQELGDGGRLLAAAIVCRNRLDVPFVCRTGLTAQRVHSAGDALCNDWADALPNERPTLSKLHGADEYFRATDDAAHVCTVPPHTRPETCGCALRRYAWYPSRRPHTTLLTHTGRALHHEQADALGNEQGAALANGVVTTATDRS